MKNERPPLLLSGFIALVAWGLVARWFPIVKLLTNSFVFGFVVAVLLSALLLLTTSIRRDAAPTPTTRAVPAFVTRAKWQGELSRFLQLQRASKRPLYPPSREVSNAIDEVLALALRDFITSWYSNISRTTSFVDELDGSIRGALLALKDVVIQEDMVNVIIARILPLFTSHMREFDQAERAVRGKALNRIVTESEELDMAIAGRYHEGNLHPAAAVTFSDTKPLQQEHLRKILIRILPSLLPTVMLKSRAVSVLIKEIVSCAVLYPVLQMLADPDTWNQMIEAYGNATLQERRTVKRMRAALDEHTSPNPKRQVASETPRLSPNDSERAFERFVRVIRKTRTLADARRFRSQIASQLAKERLVEGQDPIYLRRLEMGKRVLDQKITNMTKLENGSISNAVSKAAQSENVQKTPELSLAEIMHTASGLSYFMEYMDRQKKMPLVQFWIVVDGFRNPLEDDFGDESSSASIVWSDTDRIDIAQIAEAHLSNKDLNVPTELQDCVQTFLVAGRKATLGQYRAARTAILSAQSAVLDELESTYFPSFKKSDLYYKFLASGEGVAKTRQMSTEIRERAASPTLPRPASPTLSRPGHSLPINRMYSQPIAHKSRDLRRAALSSSDVKSLASQKVLPREDGSRRSLDGEYKPLFDDDPENDALANSTASLGNESGMEDMLTQSDVIENMEAAMTDIMNQSPQAGTSDTESDALFKDQVPIFGAKLPNPQRLEPFESAKPSNPEKVRPSLATLGLVNTSSRIGVFEDNDLFGDEEKFAEDEYADYEEAKKEVDDEIHEAAPGDLGLTEAITALTADVERLVAQDAVVDTLTRKAELTNNVSELRILGKSKASLQQEIRRKELQRQQYIVQESENSLYGRATVSIQSIMVGRDENGQEFAMYVVHVQRQGGEQIPAATWAVTKRYSEFHELHQKLRRRYPSTRNLEFPRRRMVMKLQKAFLHSRRLALEAYLRQLLRMPDVCRSREFRSFLSQQAISTDKDGANSASDTQDIVSRIYESVTDGMDEFLGNIAVIDQLSVAGQNLISAATATANNQGSLGGDEIISIPPGHGSVAEAEAELRAFEEKELEPFIKPICDIFLEVFELNKGNNWLRGRAVVVVLHQLLGGTVERKVRDIFKGFVSEESLVKYIHAARDIMWPLSPHEDNEKDKRKMREQSKPRTAAEKARSKEEASRVLNTLIPDLAGSVVGRANAQVAARRILATMNNKRLNTHLVLTLLDELVGILFDPRTGKKGGVLG